MYLTNDSCKTSFLGEGMLLTKKWKLRFHSNMLPFSWFCIKRPWLEYQKNFNGWNAKHIPHSNCPPLHTLISSHYTCKYSRVLSWLYNIHWTSAVFQQASTSNVMQINPYSPREQDSGGCGSSVISMHSSSADSRRNRAHCKMHKFFQAFVTCFW